MSSMIVLHTLRVTPRIARGVKGCRKNPARFVGISCFRFGDCPLWLDVAPMARR
ncbi:hypothetical protein [Dyella psychrodurans]|uniref:hypothetical protein n=1 Tax=Dyella psychrodurans TaxID=1927960 RepID=UPI001F1CB660|nr:hypothetical protein [Dyella psychrodurans]